MGKRNVYRLVQEALKASERADMAAGEAMSFLPVADDTGSFVFGNATYDADVKIFLGADGSYALFDSGAKKLTLSGVTFESGTQTASGVTTLTGTIVPSTDGGVLQKTNTATDDITVDATELNGLLTLNKAGVIAVTLPTPVGNTGNWIEITSLTAQAHTVTAGANLIVGIADVAATTLTAPGAIGDTVKLVSDGAKWVMTAMYGVWVSA